MNENQIATAAIVCGLVAWRAWLLTAIHYSGKLRIMERIAESVMTENAALKKERKNEIPLSQMPQALEGKKRASGKASPVSNLWQTDGFV